jgi:hypothetical protein
LLRQFVEYSRVVRALRTPVATCHNDRERRSMSPSERPKIERKRKPTASALVTAPGNDSAGVSDTDIALRAFAYYCERGYQHGSDLEDWLRAERELATVPKPAPKRRRQASA